MATPEPQQPERSVVDRLQPAPVMEHLNLWWVLAAGSVVGLAFAAADHMWRCWATFAGTLILCAVLRVVLPDPVCGGLVVRRRWVDVATLAFFGLAIGIIGFQLDLTALVQP